MAGPICDAFGVKLRFDASEDEDEFYAVRDALLDEMRVWAAGRFGDADGERAADAETFLGWKFHYGDGRLDDVSRADAAEYLLEWCPRKVSAPPDAIDDLIEGLSAYVEFMAATGRLVGGVDRAADVVAHLGDLRDEAFAAMGDTSRFGMAKSLFAAPLVGIDGRPLADLSSLESGEQLQALLDERMAAFNALPFEQRKQITGGSVAPPARRVRLDFVHVPPAPADVEASANESRLLAMVDGLVAWLGPKGRQMTQTGAFRLADARRLVELLGTGDALEGQPDPDELGLRSAGSPRSLRSSRELPMLTLVAAVAEQAEAIELTGNTAVKMSASPAWRSLTSVERARSMTDALLDTGVLGVRQFGAGIFEAIAELLDDGIVHWLVLALPFGSEVPLADIVGMARIACDEPFGGLRGLWGDSVWDRMIERQVHDVFGVLAIAGLVELHDRREVARNDRFRRQTGGTFTATALLRGVLPPHARAAGYDFAELPDLATAAADAVVAAFGDGDVEAAEVAARWLPDASPAERAAALCAVAGHAEDPGMRVGVFALLEELDDPEAAEPAVRQLLGTPAAAHAALYLVEHDLATPDELEGFFSIGPLVDHLSVLMDDPALLAVMFAEAQDHMVDDLIEAMWRHDDPNTLPVLEALGRALPDKRLAKAARKAAIKHRTWAANRR